MGVAIAQTLLDIQTREYFSNRRTDKQSRASAAPRRDECFAQSGLFQDGEVMPSGGKRVGAGRKPGGPGRGNYLRSDAIRVMAKQTVAEVLKSNTDPLHILVTLAADTGLEPALRVQAAAAAAPYCHPRLSASVVATASTTNARDAKALTDDIMQRLDRMAPPAPTIDAIVDEAA